MRSSDLQSDSDLDSIRNSCDVSQCGVETKSQQVSKKVWYLGSPTMSCVSASSCDQLVSNLSQPQAENATSPSLSKTMQKKILKPKAGNG